MTLLNLKKLQRIAWFLMIASLPFTSMPFVKKLLGSDSIASPAILFLMIILLFWLAGLIFREKILISIQSLPLLLFSCAAIIATLFSFFTKTPLFKDFRIINPILSAVITLGIGCLFFVTASSFPVDGQIKQMTLKVINWSGLIILLWCTFQAFAWYATHHYPKWMFEIQVAVSTGVLYRQRVTGFALEPSWLAHQLNMFYLPYWLSATIFRYSSHSFRLKNISFENILLAGGILTLGLTLSRVGFVAFFCMALLVVILIHNKLAAMVYSWIIRFKPGIKLNEKNVSLGIFVLYMVLIVLAIIIYSRIDPRMANLFKISLDQDNPLLRYFNQLKFGDRVIYWLTGWNIFNRYPIFGVGLGKAGFYFPENIPSYGWSLLEVRRLIYRSHILLNVKSLWFRLLAETGIVGFSFFIGWLISLIKPIIKKYKSSNPIEQTLGLSGILVLGGLIFEGLSIDSFAMPYWWISFGLAVASYEKQISRQG